MAGKSARMKISADDSQCIDNLPEQILECIFSRLESSDDRGSASEVCKMWQKVEGLTRKSVYISNCYSIGPTELSKRFKNLEKIKIKGKPRAYEFGLLVDDWGGHAGPWIEEIGTAYPKLQGLHLRRMNVTDEDLALLASKCQKLNVETRFHSPSLPLSLQLVALLKRIRSSFLVVHNSLEQGLPSTVCTCV